MVRLKSKHLHIVAFNIPFPSNYGGVIDIFYKIKALNSLGVKIHLHCFEYGREKADILNTMCETVTYYPRKMNWITILSKTPFIVKSRTSIQLLHNLSAKPIPIIFEGLHSCAYLNHPKLKDNPQFVRTHNIEQDYYKLLAKSEKNFGYKLYLYLEYLKIKPYESNLKHAKGLLTISDNDRAYFKDMSKSYLVRAFHPDNKVHSKIGHGSYALYHGNLAVAENENAALFLIQKVFKHLKYNLVIAGNKPTKKLRNEIAKHQNIKLIENPKNTILDILIQDAHIQVLPTDQATGTKLKLLKALHHGRHCIVNKKMIAMTGLEKCCAIVETPEEWIYKINDLAPLGFNREHKTLREELLKSYDCKLEAAKIASIIFPQVQ
jgi:hypothetical protein